MAWTVPSTMRVLMYSVFTATNDMNIIYMGSLAQRSCNWPEVTHPRNATSVSPFKRLC